MTDRNPVVMEIGRLGLNADGMQLAVAGWLDVEQRGYGNGRMPLFADRCAFLVYAPNGQELVLAGLIAFTVDTELNRVWVDLSYVRPEFRGQSLYTMLWDTLVRYATTAGIDTIESATSANNTVMRAVAKKQHRQEAAVQLVYKVRP